MTSTNPATKLGHPDQLAGDGMALAIKSGENPNMTTIQQATPVLSAAEAGAPAEEITCPAWCTRNQEHVSADDREHWTDDHEIGGHLLASALADGGLPRIEVASGDYMKMILTVEDAAELAGALVKLVAQLGRSYTKRVILHD